MFVVLAAGYAIGRHVVLCGRPITDDENAVTFGARMVAEGHLSVPLLQPAGAFTDLFTFQRDGIVSAMDFTGVILFAAAGIATGLGSLVDRDRERGLRRRRGGTRRSAGSGRAPACSPRSSGRSRR